MVFEIRDRQLSLFGLPEGKPARTSAVHVSLSSDLNVKQQRLGGNQRLPEDRGDETSQPWRTEPSSLRSGDQRRNTPRSSRRSEPRRPRQRRRRRWAVYSSRVVLVSTTDSKKVRKSSFGPENQGYGGSCFAAQRQSPASKLGHDRPAWFCRLAFAGCAGGVSTHVSGVLGGADGSRKGLKRSADALLDCWISDPQVCDGRSWRRAADRGRRRSRDE